MGKNPFELTEKELKELARERQVTLYDGTPGVYIVVGKGVDESIKDIVGKYGPKIAKALISTGVPTADLIREHGQEKVIRSLGLKANLTVQRGISYQCLHMGDSEGLDRITLQTHDIIAGPFENAGIADRVSGYAIEERYFKK